MSSVVFTLQVPADERYRGLAADVGRRFFEMIGGSKPQAASFADDVTASVGRLAGAGNQIDLTFSSSPTGVRVTLQSGERSDTLTEPFSMNNG
jgi:hypothetical protein